MFGVGKAFKEAVGGTQRGECDFRAVNERSETFVMPLARLAEEHRSDAAARAECLFDEADAFDTDGAGFRRQAAAERHAKFFQPAIVAARQHSGRGPSGSAAGGRSE